MAQTEKRQTVDWTVVARTPGGLLLSSYKFEEKYAGNASDQIFKFTNRPKCFLVNDDTQNRVKFTRVGCHDSVVYSSLTSSKEIVSRHLEKLQVEQTQQSLGTENQWRLRRKALFNSD